jgi:hypothetical protein
MPTQLVIEAELDVARFLASQPSPEAIIAFRPSPATVARFYDLIAAQRTGDVSDEVRKELDTFLALEHFVQLIKAEAHRRLSQQVLTDAPPMRRDAR